MICRRNVEEEEVWNVKIELGDGDLLSQNSKDGHSPGSVSDDDKYHLGGPNEYFSLSNSLKVMIVSGSNMFAIADHSEEEEEEEEAGEQRYLFYCSHQFLFKCLWIVTQTVHVLERRTLTIVSLLSKLSIHKFSFL